MAAFLTGVAFFAGVAFFGGASSSELLSSEEDEDSFFTGFFATFLPLVAAPFAGFFAFTTGFLTSSSEDESENKI